MLFRIKRFDGEKEYWSEYEVEVKKGMTVLDALFYIRENLDGSLAFRVSCRMGVCGSCTMKINNKPRLACETQVMDLKSDVIVIEPLDNYNVIKDLVVDFDGFFKKHAKVKPYLIRKVENYEKPAELIQTPKQLDEYYQFALCIKCGACYSVCPASATRKDYLGPAAFASAYRFIKDSRDEGKEERIPEVSCDGGVWRCHFAAECSEVCPKNVDPAKAVQKLRWEAVKHSIRSLLRW